MGFEKWEMRYGKWETNPIPGYRLTAEQRAVSDSPFPIPYSPFTDGRP